MKDWAPPPLCRDQSVLFAERLDDAIPQNHCVRLLNDILGKMDWLPWELKYHAIRGQPAIHPRVMVSVLLYGLLTKIRTSRALEEALVVRLDFRWLAEGRTIDHTTLSEFRRKNADCLKQLFVQIGLLARELGWLPLQQLAFDGTRIRANNRRGGTRTPEQLREMRQALAAKYAELEAQLAAADARDEEVFGIDSPYALSEELADVQRRQAQVEAALAELKRVEEAGETTPKRLPLTDPQSRLTPNKEGGFAPNYTPLATVDVASGLIVSADVIAMTDEDKYLATAINDVTQSFSLDRPPPEMLADGMMATGENLALLAEMGVTLFSPIAGYDPQNPALRDDLSQSVPQFLWGHLPTKTINRNGERREQLDKSAFVFDREGNCYWCPQGQPLNYSHTTTERKGSHQRVRQRYKADPQICEGCPLKNLCIQGTAKARQINREQHEQLRTELAERMATDEAQEKYGRRRHPGERPFAVIKQQFGARQFLLRGIEQVRSEWHWLATAFNLNRLIGLIRSGLDPPASNLPTT